MYKEISEILRDTILKYDAINSDKINNNFRDYVIKKIFRNVQHNINIK